jgi:hypothetical protein
MVLERTRKSCYRTEISGSPLESGLEGGCDVNASVKALHRYRLKRSTLYRKEQNSLTTPGSAKRRNTHLRLNPN